MVEKIKLMLSVVIMSLSIAGFYYFEDQSSTLIRVAGLLLGVVLGIVLALLTEKGQAFKGFVGETRGEFRKIVWPTKKETWQTTGIVMILVLVVAVFIWILDTTILYLIKYLAS